MRSVLVVFALSLAAASTAGGGEREVTYVGAAIGGDNPLPTFDKGYLLFLNHQCEITVYNPAGKLAFTRRLTGPGARPCSSLSAAVDSDGMVAVSLGYSGSAGYAGGILLFDASGNQTLFIDTKRYMPSHVCFDRQHSLWSIGWQRDAARNESADEKEYRIVRKFSRSGGETGAYGPRSLWGRKGEPGAAGVGLWRIAAAEDRVGALVYENHADNTAEWVEWDLDGKMVSRTPVPSFMDGGRAYTAGGRLYARMRDKAGFRLRVLDPATRAWKPARDGCAGRSSGCGLLMGAEGDDLVYLAHTDGVVQLLWRRPETTEK